MLYLTLKRYPEVLLNILVPVRQWLQFIYLSLVDTEVQVKYSIFPSKGFKGLYPRSQAKKKITLPHHILVWKIACGCLYWVGTSRHICLCIFSRHPPWSLWEELQGVLTLCGYCRVVVSEFNTSISFFLLHCFTWQGMELGIPPILGERCATSVFKYK